MLVPTANQEPFSCLERAPMPIQIQLSNHLCSSLIFGMHARTNLTALVSVRLSVSTIQGITIYSVSSGPSVSSAHYAQGVS